eukprot:s831_g25.t1
MPPKAAKAPPAPVPTPNMELVQSILAKARATAAKRKVDGEESSSPATKAKATPVPPSAVVVPKVCPVPPAGGNAMAPPPPPAKAIPPSALAPSNSTEDSSPVPKTAAPAPPPPSVKIQQFLKTAKANRLQKSAEPAAAPTLRKASAPLTLNPVPPKAAAAPDVPALNTPPPATTPDTLQKTYTPETLHTPPPKHTFSSPPTTAETVRSNSWDSNSGGPADPAKDDDWWCNSQKEYYGRQGLSWWRDDDGLGPYAPSNWFWDSWNNRYVFTQGSQSWVSESWGMEDGKTDDVDNGNALGTSPSGPETPVHEESGAPDANGADGADAGQSHVRDALACRKPSAPNVASPEPSADTAAAPPETSADKAAAPETESAEPSPPRLPPSGVLQVKQELPESASLVPAVAPPSRADALPNTADAWRCDKTGKPCTPEALYMRFYRRLRSYSFQLFHVLIVVITLISTNLCG